MANLNLLKLPTEMRSRKQWAVSTLAPMVDHAGAPIIDPKTGRQKVDKSPRNPHSGYRIDLTKPDSFVTFEEALNSGYPAIGYILTADDPLTIIDLDHSDDPAAIERHKKIYAAWYTYAETSQSGLGVHIVLRGKIGGGIRRDDVEVYDQERYIICTGSVLRDAPISDGGETLARLTFEMGGVQSAHDDIPESCPERMSDADLLSMASNARNGERFKDLYYRVPVAGEDWSHRDSQLAQMLAFYSRNHDQLIRLFRGSALYRPHDKGKNPTHYEQYYLMRTFARAIRAEMARDADLDHGRQLVTNLLANKKPEEPKASTIEYPHGLVGEIAKFIYQAAPRPVPEIAIAGALAFCAGIMGRHYNIQGTGLNLYVVLLANTGRGKEAAPDGIEALVSAMRPTMPAIDVFIGPGNFASGQALIKSLDKHPSMYSALGEFSHLLKRITDNRASGSDIVLRQMLLSLFSKSGRGKMLRSTAYSDNEKNTKDVMAPAFSFIGDTTPESYYDCFSSGLVGEGLIPRFLSITYDGPRVPMNYAATSAPSQQLLDHLISLVSSVLNMMQANAFCEVSMTPEAYELDTRFNEYCDQQINESANSLAEVWNRAHLKARRVAAILAVGRNHMNPAISGEDYLWAQELVRRDIEGLAHRIDSGDIGGAESRKAPAVEEAINDYLTMPKDRKLNTYKVPKSIIDAPHVIPYGYFRRRLKMHASFANDPRGMVPAIKAALQDAVELGLLQKLGNEQKLEFGGLRADAECYVVSSHTG